MTFNFDLETWIKVTAHLLPKGPFLGEERARFGQGEEIVLWTSDVRQDDTVISIGHCRIGP